HRAEAVAGDQEGAAVGSQPREAAQQCILTGRSRLAGGLAIEPDDLLARRRIAAGHDPGLHWRRTPGLDDDAVGGDTGSTEEGEELVAGRVTADHPDGNGARAECRHVVRGVCRAAKPQITPGAPDVD